MQRKTQSRAGQIDIGLSFCTFGFRAFVLSAECDSRAAPVTGIQRTPWSLLSKHQHVVCRFMGPFGEMQLGTARPARRDHASRRVGVGDLHQGNLAFVIVLFPSLLGLSS